MTFLVIAVFTVVLPFSTSFDSSLFLQEAMGHNRDFTSITTKPEDGNTFRRSFRVPKDTAHQLSLEGFPESHPHKGTTLHEPVVDKEEIARLEKALKDCDNKQDCGPAASLVASVLRVLVGVRTGINPPVPYGSITAFEAQLQDYYEMAKKIAPQTICEVGFNYGASLTVLMLGAPASTRALSFGIPGHNSGWASDFVPALFPRHEAPGWEGHSYCGVPPPTFNTDSRVFFVPGNSHVTVDGFERTDGMIDATAKEAKENCAKEVRKWLPAGIAGGSGKVEERIEPKLCDLTHIDGDHKHPGVYQDIADMHRLSKKGGILIMDDFQIAHVKRSVDQAVKEKLIRIISQNQTEYLVTNALKWDVDPKKKQYGAGGVKIWGVMEFI